MKDNLIYFSDIQQESKEELYNKLTVEEIRQMWTNLRLYVLYGYTTLEMKDLEVVQ